MDLGGVAEQFLRTRRARNTLAGAIRFKVFFGIVQEYVTNDYRAAFKFYQGAYMIITLGRSRWPREIEGHGCGTSMRRTFSKCDLCLP